MPIFLPSRASAAAAPARAARGRAARPSRVGEVAARDGMRARGAALRGEQCGRGHAGRSPRTRTRSRRAGAFCPAPLAPPEGSVRAALASEMPLDSATCRAAAELARRLVVVLVASRCWPGPAVWAWQRLAALEGRSRRWAVGGGGPATTWAARWQSSSMAAPTGIWNPYPEMGKPRIRLRDTKGRSGIATVNHSGTRGREGVPDRGGGHGPGVPGLRPRRLDGLLRPRRRRVRELRLRAGRPDPERPGALRPAAPAQGRAAPGRIDDQLWRNNGDGTFTDVAARRACADERWSFGATAFDYDADGWTDIYVSQLRPQPPLAQQRQRHLHATWRPTTGSALRRLDVVHVLGRGGHRRRRAARPLRRGLRRPGRARWTSAAARQGPADGHAGREHPRARVPLEEGPGLLRPHRARGAGGHVPAPDRRRHLRGPQPRGRASARARARSTASRCSPGTSTRTAGWTSTSPTTPSSRSCG